MLPDLGTGQYRGAEGPQFLHPGIRIGFAVGLPGCAHFLWRFESFVVNQPQAAAYSHRGDIQQLVPQSGRFKKIPFRFEQIEDQ